MQRSLVVTSTAYHEVFLHSRPVKGAGKMAEIFLYNPRLKQDGGKLQGYPWKLPTVAQLQIPCGRPVGALISAVVRDITGGAD